MNTLSMAGISIENSWKENSGLRNFILHESDNGTLFHRPLFMQYHGEGKFPDAEPQVIRFFKKGKLIACITGAVQFNGAEKKFISPFGSSYGGLVFHRQLSFREIEDVYFGLTDYLCKEFNQVRITSTPAFQSRTGKSLYIDHILLNKGFTIGNSDILLVHEVDSEEKLPERVHKKTFTELKQPLYKNKLQIEVIKGPDEACYDLLVKSQARFDSTPTHTFHELCRIEQLIPGTVHTFKTWSGDDLVAGIITFHVSDDILSTFYIFDTPAGRALKANHFSYYQVLSYAYRNQYKYLDFGSSSFGWRPNYPLISFKEKFDGKPFLRNIFEKRVKGTRYSA